MKAISVFVADSAGSDHHLLRFLPPWYMWDAVNEPLRDPQIVLLIMNGSCEIY